LLKYTTCGGFFQNSVNKKWAMLLPYNQVPKNWPNNRYPHRWPPNPVNYPNRWSLNVEKCDRPQLVRNGNDCCEPAKSGSMSDAVKFGVYETREQAAGACRVDPLCKGLAQIFHPYQGVGAQFDRFGGGNWMTFRSPGNTVYVGVGWGGVANCQVETCEKCRLTTTTMSTTTTTTTTTTIAHVCKHYETEDTCPSGRCSWDGDACTDPPCSSRSVPSDCCGECEWNAGKCQTAMFKACPKEGVPGSNVCPEGCTFVDSCEQCEFAAGVWKKKYSTEPWPPSSGSRPQGCFRNRKFNIKCNKFEPGSKYPSGVGKVGEKRGKWPICKLIEKEEEEKC